MRAVRKVWWGDVGGCLSVSRVLPVCITRVTGLHHACYPSASRVLLVCITRVTRLHHACYSSASRVLPICITHEAHLTSRVKGS